MTRGRLRDIQTELVHSGDPEEKVEGAVVLPIFQSATYASGGGESSYDEIRYLRLNNSPNHRALHGKLASVCGGEAAVVAHQRSTVVDAPDGPVAPIRRGIVEFCFGIHCSQQYSGTVVV